LGKANKTDHLRSFPMNIKQIARFLALGACLSLTGHAWGEDSPPALETPAAPVAPAADSAAKADTPAAKQATGKRRSANSQRQARRRGDGPQDRSDQAKRHQGRMMAQSARRPGAVSRNR
jgi:hypothetical protein